MKKYQIELTETQLKTINEALDTYSRICCGQLDEYNIWEQFNEAVKKHPDFYAGVDVWGFRDAIQDVQRQFIGGRGAGYNLTPFVGNCYQMYKSFRHHLYKEHGETYWCTDADPNILPSGTEPRPKIITLNEQVKSK